MLRELIAILVLIALFGIIGFLFVVFADDVFGHGLSYVNGTNGHHFHHRQADMESHHHPMRGYRGTTTSTYYSEDGHHYHWYLSREAVIDTGEITLDPLERPDHDAFVDNGTEQILPEDLVIQSDVDSGLIAPNTPVETGQGNHNRLKPRPNLPQNAPQRISNPSPVVEPTETPPQDTGVDKRSPDVISLPVSQLPIGTDVLRITYLSHGNKTKGVLAPDDWVLTLRLTAYTDDTTHNLSVIQVNGYDFQTPYEFFGGSLLNTNETREIMLKARPKNNSVFMVLGSEAHWHNGGGWQTIERFDINSFTVSIVGRHSVNQGSFDSSGNLIGYALGAPSNPYRRKMTGMWATLKQR